MVLELILLVVILPAGSFAIGRGLGDCGLAAALFLALAAVGCVFGATGLAAGTPGAWVTLAFGLPGMLLAAVGAYAGGRGATA